MTQPWKCNCRDVRSALEAFNDIVSGTPASDRVVDEYRATTDMNSGITNDAHDWATERNHSQYILNLVKRVTRGRVGAVPITMWVPAPKVRK